MGKGIPSFRSLVLSLKSLQNWPMGIPLWVGDKRTNAHTHTNKRVKWWMIFLKCMRSPSMSNTRDVTLRRAVPAECRCPRSRHSITTPTSQRDKYIFLRPFFPSTLYAGYIHTEKNYFVCASGCCCRRIVIVFVCVTRAMTDCMLALRAKETEWWMSPPRGRASAARAKWMGDVKSTASQSRFCAPFLSPAQICGEKSGYYCQNTTDLSPLKKKGNALIEMFIPEMRRKIEGVFLCSSLPLVELSSLIQIRDLMKSHSSWDVSQWQDDGKAFIWI